MAQDDTDFRPADLIGSQGTAGNAELLIQSVADSYPPELQAALNKTRDEKASQDLKRGDVAKQIGVDEDRVDDVAVRGDWVTVVYRDDRDVQVKAGYPRDGNKGDVVHANSFDSSRLPDEAKLSPEERDKRTQKTITERDKRVAQT